MALKGEKKAEWQRHYMARYRAEGKDPRGKTLVRPEPIFGKTQAEIGKTPLVRPTIVVSEPALVRPVVRPPLYNPMVHRPGDRVLVMRGKRQVEMVIPRLDGDGNPMEY